LNTSVKFTITGQKELAARINALGRFPADLMRETGIRAVAEAKHLVPRKTGNLGRTIRISALTADRVEVSAGGTRGVGYAAAVELGTKPHIILPKRAKALAWGGARTLAGRVRSGGRPTHFARKVRHPGTRAQPFLVPGLEKAVTLVGLDGLIKRWNGAA